MKVLIVDDSDLLQTRLRNALLKTDKCLDITQARSFQMARKVFPILVPDTVILDIALPDGSGIDLLRIFKKDNPSTQVIIFTNYPTSEFKKKCRALGADHFIDKSNLNSLITTLGD